MLHPRFVHWFALICAVSVTACGQNAHLVDPPETQSAPDSSNRSNQPGTVPSPAPHNGSDGGDNRTSGGGNQQKQGETPKQPTPKDPPKDPVEPRNPLKPNGEVTFEKSPCSTTTQVHVVNSRRVTPSELQKLELPYRSTKLHPIQTLHVGQANRRAANGVAFVQDAQTVFAFDLPLPPIKNVVKVKGAALGLDLLKVSVDRYLRTEMLCLLEPKVCSGELYQARTWQDNLNPGFWSETPHPLNDLFARVTLENQVGTTGGRGIFSNQIALELTDFFPGLDLIEVFYGSRDRILPVAIVDDTVVKRAALRLEIEVSTCVLP